MSMQKCCEADLCNAFKLCTERMFWIRFGPGKVAQSAAQVKAASAVCPRRAEGHQPVSRSLPLTSGFLIGVWVGSILFSVALNSPTTSSAHSCFKDATDVANTRPCSVSLWFSVASIVLQLTTNTCCHCTYL